MGRRAVSFKEFKSRFENESNNEYEYIRGYTRISEKITIKHTICGHIYEVKAIDFINVGKRCPNCYGTKRKEQDEIEKQIKELTNDEYIICSEYKSCKKKIKIKHVICGHMYEVTPSAFLKGSRCPNCSNKFSRYSTKEIQENIDKIYDANMWNVLNYYENGKKKVRFVCNKCGKEYCNDYISFKRGVFKCNECIKIKKARIKLLKKFIQIKNEKIKVNKISEKLESKYKIHEETFKIIHGNTLTILEKKYNVSDKFKVKCNICDEIFVTNFKNLKRGNSCPRCNMSKGERKIEQWFINNEIVYDRQYSIKDSIIEKLKFDFAALSTNDELILIEYDGEQHYSEDAQFGVNNKTEKYNKLRKNDDRKNSYTNDNNIKLIRIPYYDFDNIECILKNTFPI